MLKLPIARKSVNITEGVHPSIFKGIGLDFEELSLYTPGDSLKDIDWKASARSSSPVIRRFLADSNTNMIFVIDSGKESVTRGTSGERKIDIMHTICTTFGIIAAKRFDSVGIIAGDSRRIMNERAKNNLGEVSLMLRRLEKMSNPLSPVRNYAKVLAYANQYLTKRSFIVLVFDEASAFGAQDYFVGIVRRLKERHDVFCISIRSINPFRSKLPQITGKVVDISDYHFVPAYFRNEKISGIVKKNILVQRNKLIDGLKSIGVPHLSVMGSEDFVAKYAKVSQRSEIAKL